MKAASAYGTRKIEVALVLDNTGSMASANKINELKKASKSLISILETASVEAGQIRISIVPYHTTRVKLSTSYRFDNWLTNTPTAASALPIPCRLPHELGRLRGGSRPAAQHQGHASFGAGAADALPDGELRWPARGGDASDRQLEPAPLAR